MSQPANKENVYLTNIFDQTVQIYLEYFFQSLFLNDNLTNEHNLMI